jgi:LysM repeat protein
MTPFKEILGEEEEIMHETLEKTPGVYVRTNEPANHELDMLWSGSRTQFREERSPFLFIAIGFVLGVIVTAAAFIFLVSKPETKMGESSLMAPVVQEKDIPQKHKSIITTPNQTESTSNKPLQIFSKPEPTNTQAPVANQTTTVETGSQSYKVKNGDTLGSIASQFYGSSSPEMVDKIMRANNMKDPNKLTLDQELVIPSKN